jgi:ribonuclease HI
MDSLDCGKQKLISIGLDAFIGGNDRCFFSPALVSHIHNQNIYTLAQAARPYATAVSTDWLDSNHLKLTGMLAKEWDSFVLTLRLSGITLSDSNDHLVWSWNPSTGSVPVNSAFHSIIHANFKEEKQWWFKAIWLVKIPSKIILFVWLCLKDSILSGVNYQRRGGIRPFACSLCLAAEDSTEHIFNSCKVSKFLWKEILALLKIQDEWGDQTLEGNLLNWFFRHPKKRHVPFMVIWGIWKYRNKILFENWQRQDSAIVKKIFLSIQEIQEDIKPDKLDYILNPVYFDDSPIGYFDGAASGNKCGIGLYIKISNVHNYKAFFAGGEGNNMKAELLGLWGLLHLAKTLSLSRLMIVGDSKVTIDWIKGATSLNCIYLRPWQQKIKALQEQFESVKYIHVHRIFNHIVDQLSKQALNCSLGIAFP